MDSKLSVVISAFESIQKYGWCNVGHSHMDEIEIIKNTIEKCGKTYSTHEHEYSIQIFVN